MSGYALYLLPIMFLAGICGILVSLSRRVEAPQVRRESAEAERRHAAAAELAERRLRERGMAIGDDAIPAQPSRLRARRPAAD